MAKQKTRTKKQTEKRISNLLKPDNMTLQEWQIALRKQMAQQENYAIEAVDDQLLPGEYSVRNPKTRQTYKVVYRGVDSPWNYCSCMDFKTSRLGTCKHLEATKEWLKKNCRFKVYKEVPPYTSVYLSYRDDRKVCIRIGSDRKEEFQALAERYFDRQGVLLDAACMTFPRFLQEASSISDTFRCYSDALDFVLEQRESHFRQQMVEELDDKQLDTLLSVPLYPYQKEGVRFAVVKGRALIADEMGLGKTIQAIAAAEVLRLHHLADSVLVVCPTSLKYQWKSEIERFTGADVLIVEGNALHRQQLYEQTASFKIVSYHSMANDVKSLGRLHTDMVILDEVQRLKNWQTQIAIVARRIDARYMVALSGTPLENKLEELFSVMELVDQYCLGPYYLFRQESIVTDETGKVVGYQHLNAIGDRVRQRLIRRRKCDVRLQLPERQDKNLLVPVTQQQMDIHEENRETVARLIHKWKTHHFLSEVDRRRLLLCLNMMRMVSDSTYVLDQKTRYDVKIDEAMNIIDDLILTSDGKVVVFSQWERMARLLAKELENRHVAFEYLHGGVPSEKRGRMVQRFQTDSECRVFLSTDAGSTGLNLQAASLIINLDLPWNPAVLEQRIGRIYRLGQHRSVQVINIISKGTIEEQMIGKLRFKQDMFNGVLDDGEDSIFVGNDKFKQIVEVVGSYCENPETEETASTVMPNELEQDDRQLELPFQEQDAPEITVSEEQDAVELPQESRREEGTVEREDTAPSSPQQLVEQGLSFFSQLARTLQSPEATRHLIDTIVRTDEATGETSIHIPVADKKSVEQVFTLFAKMVGGQSE